MWKGFPFRYSPRLCPYFSIMTLKRVSLCNFNRSFKDRGVSWVGVMIGLLCMLFCR